MVAGFIVPRIIMTTYGSEINGLISSISQFIAYFNLLEAGIAGAVTWALYKPLAERNIPLINGILVATKNFYNRAGYIFVALTLGLAPLYPALVAVESLNTVEVALLVAILGVSGALEFFTLAKYRALLTADQKTYVISLASTIAIILNTLIIASLAYFAINIVIIRGVALLAVFLRTALLYGYVRQHYRYLDYSVAPAAEQLHKHWDAMYLQILGVVQNGGPIVLATLFTNLKLVSVYAVYNLILSGLNSLLGILISGLAASFGDLIARGERETLKKAYNEFELSYYLLITVAYAVAFITIMPFVQIYTQNVHDIDYNMPLLGFLMVLNGLLYNIKTPQGMLVISAGWYRETRNQSTLQAGILLLGGMLLGAKFGLYGIVWGSILSNLYRDIDLAIFIPRRLLQISPRTTFLRLGLLLVILLTIYVPCQYLEVEIGNLFSWCLYAGAVLCYATAIALGYAYFWQRETLSLIITRLLRLRK